MALCLPRKRRATSLATRPRTLSVASITNHSCTTSAGFALKVDMRFFFKRRFVGFFSTVGFPLMGSLRWGFVSATDRTNTFAAEPHMRCEAFHYTKLACFQQAFDLGSCCMAGNKKFLAALAARLRDYGRCSRSRFSQRLWSSMHTGKSANSGFWHSR